MTEPELQAAQIEPKGVLQKNMKMFVYLGACAAGDPCGRLQLRRQEDLDRRQRRRTSRRSRWCRTTPTTTSQDLKNQLEAEQQKEQQAALAATAAGDPALTNATPAQQAAAAGYTPTGLPVGCVPGQPCARQNGYPQQPGGVSAAFACAAGGSSSSPRKTRARLRVALLLESRLQPPAGPAAASSRSTAELASHESLRAACCSDSSMIAPRAAGEQPQAQTRRLPSVRRRSTSIRHRASPM